MTVLTHDQARQFLEMDREQLSAVERAALERHLADCTPCRSVAAELAALQTAVERVLRKQWADVRPDPQLENRMQTWIRTQTMPKRILNNALGLAGLVAFTIVVIAFFSMQTQSTANSPLATPTMTPAVATLFPTPKGSPFPTPTPLSGHDFYQLQRLLTTNQDVYQPAVSPDGRRVIYASLRNNNSDIYVFDLPSGTETRLTDDPFYDISPSWSPDGTRIAYRKNGRSQDDALLVDQIVMNADGSNKQVISSGAQWRANEALASLAWSPSSDRLAYVDATALVIVSVTEQRELRRFDLTASQSHSQPAWFDENHILFTDLGVVNLGNVATGAVEAVAGTAGFVSQVMALGADIAYVQQEGNTARVIRQDLSGAYSVTLSVFQASTGETPLPPVGLAAWSPDGRFVAVPTSLGLYAAIEHAPASWQHAPMFKLDANILSVYSDGVSWLPDSSGFVFAARLDGQFGLYLAQLNLETIKSVEDNEPVAQVPPLLSSPTPTPPPTPASVPFSTPTPTAIPYPYKRFNTFWILTEPPGGAYLPAASPVGGRVIYTSERDGNRDLYRVDFATLAETRLTDDPRIDTAAAWSPDGSRIAYQRYASATTDPQSIEWVVMNVDGSDPQIIASGTQQPDNERPAWSPDGTRLAFTAGTELVVVSINDRLELRRFDLTERQLHSQPVWLDDERILFISRGVLQVGHVATGTVEAVTGPSVFVSQVMVRNSALVYIQQEGITAYVIGQNLDGTEAVTLTTIVGVSPVTESGPVEGAALSPDGRYIAVQTVQGSYVAYVGPKQSAEALPAGPHDVLEISWLPDSSGFVCVSSSTRPILYLAQAEPGSGEEPYSPLVLPTLTPTPTPSTDWISTPTPTLPPVPQTETPVPPTIPN